MSGSGRQSKNPWLCGTLVLAALSCAAGASPDRVPALADAAALRTAALDTLADLVLVENGADEALRNEAVSLLGRYGGPVHTAVLLRRLESAPSSNAAVAAVAALGELGDATVVPTLHELFVAPESHRNRKDVRWSVADAAGEALLKCGKPGLDVVIEASRGPDAQVRRRALRALAHAGDRASLDVFTRSADDEDRWVRLETAAILGRLGDAAAVPTLQKLLDDTDPDVRLEAARSLARLGNAAGADLLRRRTPSQTGNALALRLLARLDPSEHLPALLVHLKEPASGEELDDIAHLLAACDQQQIVPPLLSACRDKSAVLRQNAAALLARLKSRDTAPALTKLLQDPSWNVRTHAALALGAIGDTSALPPLVTLARQLEARGDDHRRTPAREACAIALAQVGDRDAAARLCLVEFGATKRTDASPEVLARVGGPTLEHVLIESVQHPDPGRPSARLLNELRALELIGSKAAGPVLEALLRERPYARMRALDLPQVWVALLDALSACAGPAAARTVAAYVECETPMVRCAACRAILQLTTQEALRE